MSTDLVTFQRLLPTWFSDRTLDGLVLRAVEPGPARLRAGLWVVYGLRGKSTFAAALTHLRAPSTTLVRDASDVFSGHRVSKYARLLRGDAQERLVIAVFSQAPPPEILSVADLAIPFDVIQPSMVLDPRIREAFTSAEEVQ